MDRDPTHRPITQRDIAPALAALDRALGEQSAYGDLVEASRRLVVLRGMLIAERRRGAPDPDRRLDRLNAILSLGRRGRVPARRSAPRADHDGTTRAGRTRLI